ALDRQEGRIAAAGPDRRAGLVPRLSRQRRRRLRGLRAVRHRAVVDGRAPRADDGARRGPRATARDDQARSPRRAGVAHRGRHLLRSCERWTSIAREDAMRLGLLLRYAGLAGGPPMEHVLEAERLGYHSVWCGEAYGNDAVSPIAWVLARTTRINAGTGIMQM